MTLEKEQIKVYDKALSEALDDGSTSQENYDKLKEAGLIQLDYKTWVELRSPKKIVQKKKGDWKKILKENEVIKNNLSVEEQEEINKATGATGIKKKNSQRGNFVDTQFIIEQVFKDNENLYLVYNKLTKSWTYQTSYITPEGYTITPIKDDETYKGFIKLPSEPIEYESEYKLIADIENFINKWLDIPTDDVRFAAYNILKSWVYRRFHSINYLRVMGDYGTGKSRYLDAIGSLHYHNIKTTGTVTPAALFRIISKWGDVSISIDEADVKYSDETQDIIKIINQGYEANNPVMRCDPEEKSKVEFFDVYCPKILATRKEFEDKAVESRCFTTQMRSTSRKNIPPNLNRQFTLETQLLINKLLMWKLRNFDALNPDIGETYDFGKIDPRIRQISNSFISLISNNPIELARFKGFLAKKQSDLMDERVNSWEGMITSAITEMWIEGNQIPNPQQIIEKADLRDHKGNLYKGKSISSVMKRLGFGTTFIKKIDGVTKRIYEIKQEVLEENIEKYVDDLDLKEKFRLRVTQVTPSRQGDGLRDFLPDQKDEVTNRLRHIYHVTNVTRNPVDVISYIKSEGGVCNIDVVKDMFGKDIIENMISKGDLVERPSSYLRVVD